MKRSTRAGDKRVPKARRLRRDMTDAERKLWGYLRGPPFESAHFRRQATLGPYFADFASHKLRLIVEVDGGQHNDRQHADRDKARSAYLKQHGYRVVRFWNNEVLTNIEGVCEAIYSTLATSSASPHP